jgi:hypothetical protein
MKAQIRSKTKGVSVWVLMFILSFFVATQAEAQAKRYVPVAICQTSGTNIPLPYYVCCGLKVKGHYVWKNTWVPVSCKRADPYARYSMGCRTTSPVIGTGMPIAADCQFSYSTGKIHRYRYY